MKPPRNYLDLGTRTREAGKFTSEERVSGKARKEENTKRSGWNSNQNEG
jgi:hypothetical protein